MTESDGEAVKAVWKFHLEVTEWQHIKMPEGAEPLSVQIIDNRLWLWAMVDVDATETRRLFRTLETGQRISTYEARGLAHVATYQSLAGGFIYHLFDCVSTRFADLQLLPDGTYAPRPKANLP